MPAQAGIQAHHPPGYRFATVLRTAVRHLDSRPSMLLRTCFRGNDENEKVDFALTQSESLGLLPTDV